MNLISNVHSSYCVAWLFSQPRCLIGRSVCHLCCQTVVELPTVWITLIIHSLLCIVPEQHVNNSIGSDCKKYSSGRKTDTEVHQHKEGERDQCRDKGRDGLQ